MKQLPTSRFVTLGILAQVILAVSLVWLTNLLAVNAIERFRESSIADTGVVNVESLRSEIDGLNKDVEKLRQDVTRDAARTLPTVQELRELANRSQVHLRRMEKQTSSGARNAERDVRYSILAVGGLDNQMDFLKQLEESHILVSESIMLQRYNEDGTTLALSLVMAVREQ